MIIETDPQGAPVLVEDLDEEWLLQLAEHAEVESRRAERAKLRYAYQWAVLHPAQTVQEAATWGDLGGRDRDCDLKVGGDGTPDVAAFAAEPLAAALGISTRAAMRLMADALDLAHRLPAIQAKVDTLEIAPWRARKVAQATTTLSKHAAAYVDAQLAPVIDSCGPTRIDRVVEEARATFDTAEQADEEAQQRAGWGVRLVHGPSGRFAGTSWLEAAGDTPTLTRFHDLVTTTAHDLWDPEHPLDLEQRKIAAIGIITDRATGTDGSKKSTATKLYLHLDAQTLLDPTVGLGHAERLGPLTTGLIKDWLDQTNASILPVLRTDRTDAVDAHDPPAWMRELVILRDRYCVHPYCERSSRDCDLDHIEAYVEMDDGGPPGQTNPDNLAPLCRGHHRAKTFGGWHYQRNADGTYTWTTPQRRHYTVHPDGTVRAH